MTTSGMSFGDRNGLQDEKKRPLYQQQNVPPKSTPGKISASEPANVLICFKSLKKSGGVGNSKKNKDEGKGENVKRKKRSKSRELRAGILYVGCDCERRNGLQDQCRRSECQGSPDCLTVPPTCPPSEFAQGKHLAKIFADLLKRREAAAQKFKEGKDGGGKGGKDNKQGIDYDCFPLDLFMENVDTCPVCNRAMDTCSYKHGHEHPAVILGPINIELPADCACCPGAS